MTCGYLGDLYRDSRPELLTPLAREIRQAGSQRAGRQVSGGSDKRGLWNSEEGQFHLAGRLALMGKFVEEVVLELSS